MAWRKEDFYQAIRSAGFDGCEEYAQVLCREAERLSDKEFFDLPSLSAIKDVRNKTDFEQSVAGIFSSKEKRDELLKDIAWVKEGIASSVKAIAESVNKVHVIAGNDKAGRKNRRIAFGVALGVLLVVSIAMAAVSIGATAENKAWADIVGAAVDGVAFVVGVLFFMYEQHDDTKEKKAVDAMNKTVEKEKANIEKSLGTTIQIKQYVKIDGGGGQGICCGCCNNQSMVTNTNKNDEE